jgi:hypothetical protein
MPQVRQFFSNYAHFFSPVFLFEAGDSILRHSVPGFGELYVFYLPFIAIGAVLAARRGRAAQLLLLWVALYPAGASLMNEIPSASRSIIGAAGFCTLAAIGFEGMLAAFRWAMRRPRPGRIAEAIVACVALAVLGRQCFFYLRTYALDYPKQAAAGNVGFQYGYRDVIRHMEAERGQFAQLALSMTDANQPQIFALFYNRVDPRRWAKQRDSGYMLVRPDDYPSYSLDRPTLFGLNPSDVKLFSDLTIERNVVAPNGETVFVVAATRARKEFLANWLGLGLFPNENNSGVRRNFIDPARLALGAVQGAYGLVDWRPIRQVGIYVDLNRYYANADLHSPGNPEWVCAYAATLLDSPSERDAYLELASSWGDSLEAWLDGRSLTAAPLVLHSLPARRRFHLPAGKSSLLIKSCETIAWWDFAARITDSNGQDLRDLRSAASLPPPGFQPSVPSDAAELRVVEGFDALADGPPPESGYPDYRGGIDSWRASVAQASRVVWRSAPVAEAAPTVLAFTATMSEEAAELTLFVDGRRALAFESGPSLGARSWEENGYRMAFIPKMAIGGWSGVVLLSVPPDTLQPGRPLELRVEPGRGNPGAWFMLKGHRDTAAHEHMTPLAARDALDSGWEEIKEPGSAPMR